MGSIQAVRGDLVLTKFTLPVCEVLRSPEGDYEWVGEVG